MYGVEPVLMSDVPSRCLGDDVVLVWVCVCVCVIVLSSLLLVNWKIGEYLVETMIIRCSGKQLFNITYD